MNNVRALRCLTVTFAFLTGLFSVASHARAQGTGRLVGRVVDASTGAGISAAQVELVGLQSGALTSLDGRYVLNGVPAGQVTLRASSIGYSPKTVIGIVVTAGGVIEQNLTLDTEAVQLGALQVSAAAERGSVNRALDQQRTATAIVNSVTAEQISRSPDGDAAAAVQRVAGVTLMDNKYVQVRGLGERYTTTSLNGARIPSPEPEKKLVPLDLFPAGVLETITTSKTFTPDQPGDFSGAQVDIRTREFPGRSQTVSTGLGFNSRIAGSSLVLPPSYGGEWLARGSGDRELPDLLKSDGLFERQFSPAETNALVRSFNNAWSAQGKEARPNMSVGGSLGGTSPVFGQAISYVFSGTYSNSNEIRANEVRALAFPEENGGTAEIERYTGSTGRTSVLWGGVLNLSTLFGSHSRLALNSTYNRSADNEAREELGFSDDDAVPLQITRLRYVERAVRSVQLLGDHEFGSRHRLDWTVTSSGVLRSEPDRSEIVYVIQEDPATGQTLPPAWFSGEPQGAVRTFGTLEEDALEATTNYRLSFGSPARRHTLKFGGIYRTASRDADNRAYGITAPSLSRDLREQLPEDIFGSLPQGDADVFRVSPLLQGGSYTAQDHQAAGYGMMDIALATRLRVIGGVRVEHSKVEVSANPTIGDAVLTTPTYTDWLPALSLNFQLSDRQNLRFSLSQTLSRPEYREMAPIAYRDVLGGENIIGNENLRRTLIRNADLRWELYPAAGEVLSLALFAKSFKDPIERVYLGTSGTRIVTFVNADQATNYGVEIEARKNLGSWVESLEPFTAFANTTIMRSDITVQDAGRFKDERAMVGQAPYVVNAGLTYAREGSDASATILYNVMGRRIYSASEFPLPDVYEQARHNLDLSLRFPVLNQLLAKIDFRNLLDAPYNVTQGVAVREYFKTGRIVSMGISWRP
jgi:outer membrane receptor protein involved in Fe transport